MSNMFNKSTEIGGAFKANEMVLTFAGFGAGYLITSVDATYQIMVSRFRELGSTRTYFIEGDSGGTLNLGQVVGPGSSIVPLVRAYSDVCSIAQNVIKLSYASGACSALGGGAPDLTFSGVIINQYKINSQSTQGMTTTAGISGMYESLHAGSAGDSLSGVLNAAGNLAAAAEL